MKKLIVCALCACLAGAAAFGSQYQVYKLQFNARTTDAKAVSANVCCGLGDEYCYREKKTVKIQGILSGCGCGAIKADGVCDVAFLYLWDATRQIAITNVEPVARWTVQRVGKNATVVEHFCSFKATYGEDDRYGFEITMAGFGTYKNSTKDADLSYVSSIDGNFAGTAYAPYYFKAGVCTACYTSPSYLIRSMALEMCENCSTGLLESEESERTPFYGTYSLKYDSSKSNACSKKGLSQTNLGLPKYVAVTDYAATNMVD